MKRRKVEIGLYMQRVATNTIILAGVNVSSAVFGFLISVIIGRGLGDAGLGRFSLVLAWTFALSICAEFGLNTLITREVARHREAADQYLEASTLAKISLSLILIAALEMATPAIVREGETIVGLRLGAFLILFNALYGSFTAIFRAFEQMLPILILNSGGLLIQLTGTFVLLSNGQGVFALVVLAIAVQLLQIAAAFLLYRTAFPHSTGQIALDTALLSQLLRAAFPFAMAGILSVVEMRVNFVLLGALQDERAVGWYSAATRFSEATKFLPNAFFGAVFPAFTTMSAHVSSVDMDNNFRRTRWALTLFAFAVAIALSALAQPAITQSFGPAFGPAEPVLVILAWSLIPALVNGLTILYFYSRGDEAFVNKMMGLALLLQIVTAIPLIRLFGAQGAALSALFGDIVLGVLLQKGLANVVVDSFRGARRDRTRTGRTRWRRGSEWIGGLRSSRRHNVCDGELDDIKETR